jgi:hypothetical protein
LCWCTIGLQPLVDTLLAEAGQSCWIVEGAGTLVPVNDSETIAD